MFGFQRMNRVSAVLPSFMAVVAIAGCSSKPGASNGASTGGQSSVGTTTPGAGSTSTVTGGAGATTMPAGLPPTDTCSGAIPASYTTTCSACHTQNGSANARYPDLYQFKGTLADFTARVRMGSAKGMAAYSTDLISDADVAAIYGYFTGGTTRPGLDTVALGDVVPLFTAADAVNPPIVSKRADGVIVTRGAGRVRGRHEKEGSFGPFLENYFDNRSYGFIVEDFTPTGVKRIRVTYLPITKPDHTGNRITNWRAWKEPGKWCRARTSSSSSGCSSTPTL